LIHEKGSGFIEPFMMPGIYRFLNKNDPSLKNVQQNFSDFFSDHCI